MMKHFEHQAQVLAHSRDLPHYALLWEMRCGKTRPTLETAVHLYQHGKIDAVLVLAPKGVHCDWATEHAPLWAPQMQPHHFTTSQMNAKYIKNEMSNACVEPFPMVAMNFDAVMGPLYKTQGQKLANWLLKNRKVLYVLDESTAIKSPGSARTKRILSTSPRAPYKRILTGTPMTNTPFDLYKQFEFLDATFWPSHGFATYGAFKTYFGIIEKRMVEYTPKGTNKRLMREYPHVVGYRNLKELNQIVSTCSSRITRDQVFDLPPKQYTKRYFEMTKEQRRVYADLRNHSLSVIGTDIVTTPLPITRLLRQQQVTCGYIPNETGTHLHLLAPDNPRIHCLQNVLNEAPGQAIIWARFTEDIEQILRLLGSRATRYDGKVTDKQRAVNKKKFQQGKAQYFVGNAAAASKGHDLSMADTVVYYSNDFDLEHRLQSEDRAQHPKKPHNVLYVDLVCRGTTDEHIIRALRSKVNIAAVVNGDNLKEWI